MSDEKTFLAVKSRTFADDNQVRFFIGPADVEPRTSPDDFTVVVVVRLEAIASDPKLFEEITAAVKSHVNRAFGISGAGDWTTFKARMRGN